MTIKRGKFSDHRGPQFFFSVIRNKSSWLIAFRPKYWSLRKVVRDGMNRRYVGPFEFQRT